GLGLPPASTAARLAEAPCPVNRSSPDAGAGCSTDAYSMKARRRHFEGRERRPSQIAATRHWPVLPAWAKSASNRGVVEAANLVLLRREGNSNRADSSN